MSLSRRTLLALGLLAALPSLASAQAPQTRIRGSIASFDGTSMAVITREGPTVTIAVPPTVMPSALKRMSLKDIGPNSYVATVAGPAADGTLQSVYVLILPDALRGKVDTHSEWDLAPGTSMTNATVTSQVSSASGEKLTMTYKGTPIDIVVPAPRP